MAWLEKLLLSFPEFGLLPDDIGPDAFSGHSRPPAEHGMNQASVSKPRLPRFSLRLFHAFTTLNPWHFLWISIVLSEVLTALMGLLLKGSVTYDYLVTGGVVSLIVAGIVIFLLKIMMRIRLDNKTLRAEVEFQSLLMETIPDLLYVLDPAGTLIKWNGKAEEVSGFSRDELAGRHALFFIAEEDRDGAQAGLEEAYLKGTATRELRLLTKDGKKVNHRFSGASIRDSEGRFIGFIGIGRDISNLKKIEEEMNRVQKLESVSILAGSFASDFNYLITSIRENIHLAVMHADEREILRENLQNAHRAAIRAKDMTKQLLSFSRGGFPKKKLTALGHIIREYTDAALHGSAIKCDFTIPGSLWNAEVDEAQIGQAINALVLNAVEAMPGGGTIAITADNIEVSSDELPRLPGGRYVRISVADCGIGIPQELLQTIFDPYVTTRHRSRGLGLTITYAIIRNHNGHIRVESEPGRGSVFHIYLPALSLSHHSSQE